MRQRLSWDEEKVAELSKTADPYTMNQEHKNPPVEKYRTGDPSAWAEDPNMATPWKTEGRTETGHPAPARQAVVQARKMEDKAIKCITIAQRMLPGASDETVEEQATHLMYLPEKSVLATLRMQSDLASVLAADKDDDEEDDEEKEAAKKEDTSEEEEEKEKEKEAAKKDDDEEDEEKEAAKKEDTPEEEKEKEAGKKEDTPEEEKEKEANSGDLLDQIFQNETNTEKSGAKSLSGLVKQASSGDDPLNNMWDAPPDVSSAFK